MLNSLTPFFFISRIYRVKHRPQFGIHGQGILAHWHSYTNVGNWRYGLFEHALVRSELFKFEGGDAS